MDRCYSCHCHHCTSFPQGWDIVRRCSNMGGKMVQYQRKYTPHPQNAPRTNTPSDSTSENPPHLPPCSRDTTSERTNGERKLQIPRALHPCLQSSRHIRIIITTYNMRMYILQSGFLPAVILVSCCLCPRAGGLHVSSPHVSGMLVISPSLHKRSKRVLL